MKMLLLLSLSIFSLCSFAEQFTLIGKGDASISKAESRMKSVKKICVYGEDCAAFGSNVKIEVFLKGCVDRFGGYFSTFKIMNGRGVLSFGAINIFNTASLVTDCVQANTKEISIYVPYEGEIVLEDLNYTGQMEN
jgi:hypothetical protein